MPPAPQGFSLPRRLVPGLAALGLAALVAVPGAGFAAVESAPQAPALPPVPALQPPPPAQQMTPNVYNVSVQVDDGALGMKIFTMPGTDPVCAAMPGTAGVYRILSNWPGTVPKVAFATYTTADCQRGTRLQFEDVKLENKADLLVDLRRRNTLTQADSAAPAE